MMFDSAWCALGLRSGNGPCVFMVLFVLTEGPVWIVCEREREREVGFRMALAESKVESGDI